MQTRLSKSLRLSPLLSLQTRGTQSIKLLFMPGRVPEYAGETLKPFA